MILITGQKQFYIENKTAVAIGKFDGVHRGHKVLLDKILEASNNGLKTVVFTFDPPFEELFGNGEFRYLLTRDEKRRIFEDMGIDYLIEFPMDVETASMEPTEFVLRYLVEYLNAGLVVAGDDLSFGKMGAGDYALLEKLSVNYGFKTISINKIKENNQVISSTLIRDKVSSGAINEANILLGYDYFISGKIVHGKALGRTMGVPTINVDFDSKKVIPPYGVYYSQTALNGKSYKSITNIGTKPTIKNDMTVNAETFIYDFNEEVYEIDVKVNLMQFKRPEMRFNSFEELERQIHLDLKEGSLFKMHKK